MYKYYNPNPRHKSVGDCVIRAISKVTGWTWDQVFLGVTDVAFEEKDMPSANHIWGKFLKLLGYRKYIVSDRCPNCYTVKEFCIDNPVGRYVLATGSHVIAVIDGDYYDSWDSGEEVPAYYWKESLNADKPEHFSAKSNASQ